MKEVFAHLSAAEVNVRRALLEDAGIHTFVRNEALSTLTNPLIGPFQPSLCVVNDEDFDQAMSILRSMNAPSSAADWTCPQCKELVPGAFDSCWNCQTMKPESLLA